MVFLILLVQQLLYFTLKLKISSLRFQQVLKFSNNNKKKILIY